MKKDILHKIEDSLTRRIKREETVIFILVEISKILEIENKRNNYPVLDFFRNWVVHIELDRENAQIILEEYIEKSDKLKYKFLSFEVLRDEMSKFLKNYSLPLFVADEGWFQFRSKLVSIICDQPVLKNSKHTPNNGKVYLKELRITEPPEMFKRDLISYDLILSDDTNVGGSILLGDKDKMARKYDELNRIWFRHHYNRKAFLEFSAQKHNNTNKDDFIKLDKKIQQLYSHLKQDEDKMTKLRTEITNDELGDELYK